MKKIFTSICTLFILATLLVACVPQQPIKPEVPDNNQVQNLNDDEVTFLSAQQARTLLRSSQSDFADQAVFDDIALSSFRGVAADTVVQEAAPSIDSGENTYSKTNVQYEGVDEADIVKTDGNYIYVLSQGTLKIIQKQQDSLELLGTLNVSEDWYGQSQLFLIEDGLIVVTTKQSDEIFYPLFSLYPQQSWERVTHILKIDVSSKDDPKVLQKATLSGNPTTSRILNDELHVLTTQSPWYYADIVVPWVRTDTLVEPRIGIIGQPRGNEIFSTMAKFDVNDLSLQDSLSLITNYDASLTMNTDSILVTFSKPWSAMWGTDTYFIEQKQRFSQTVLPHIDGGLANKLKTLMDSVDYAEQMEEAWLTISDEIAKTYPDANDEEFQEVLEKITNAQSEYDVQLQRERQKTTIIRLDIDDYTQMKQGQVPGNMLNQFSIDEYDNYIRVATTTSIWDNGRRTSNNVYILDNDLELASKIENIAPEEQIFSVRFTGDLAYMVTFEQIDPFFVIDLDPRNPKVLGEVKLPGFSNYLHPISEDVVLGVGQERIQNDQGVSRQVVKLSLFDVSDRTNPIVLSEYLVDEGYSSSPAQQTHKAFTYDSQENILYLPINWYTYSGGYGSVEQSWSGVYAWKIDEDIQLFNTYVHRDEQTSNYWSIPQVQRALYFANQVVSISDDKMVLFDASAQVLDEVTLPQSQPNYRYYYD